MLSTFSWGNIALIALINTFCNVAQKAPDNIGHEKILLNVVLILLGYVTQETPDNIAQASELSSGQHHFSAIFVTGCCQLRRNIVQIFQTLCKKNWAEKIPGQHWTKDKIVASHRTEFS